MLQVFPVVLTRTTLLFSDLRVLTKPSNPEGHELPPLPQASLSLAHISLKYLLKKLFSNSIILPPIPRKHKAIFRIT